MDPHGFARPVVARTFLAPINWSVKGGVQWTQSRCLFQITETHAVVEGPEENERFEVYPDVYWQWSQDPIAQQSIQQSGCIVAPPMDPRQVIEQYVLPRFRPEARIVFARPMPDVAQAVYREAMDTLGPMLQQGRAGIETEAGQVRITYTQGGEAYEEWITVAIATLTTQSFNSQALMQGYMIPEPAYTFFATDIYGFRAPKGELNQHENLYATMMASMRMNPAWERALQQIVTSIGQTAIREAGRRAAIWRDAYNQVGDMMMDSWHYRQETLDRVSTAWSRSMRGVDAYRDPTTQQTVELTAGYGQAWTNGAGEYVLTTNPGFDPNTVYTDHSWERMSPVE